MKKIIVSRAFGVDKAEVVINEDGSFMIGKYGPLYTIRNEPINRDDYGWDEVSILDAKGQVVMTGHVIDSDYTFGQFRDTNVYRAAAQALWDL